ncbi:MAG TPA: hypothetical protein VND98_12055 [Solirubrobacterales bacterium]|nr:hypothetical protein [Solirubrobacterales bacterium]
MSGKRASKSAVGGAADAAGGSYRAAVAAVLGAHALGGWGVRGWELPLDRAVPVDLRIETDDPIDDIGCTLRAGGHAYIQAKRTLQLSSRPGGALAKAIAQCCAAVETQALDADRDRLVIATADPSGRIDDLQAALRRRRNPLAGRPTGTEATALEALESLLLGLSNSKRDLLLDCLVVWVCDAEHPAAHEAERASLLLDGAIVADGVGERAFEALKAKAHDLARLREGLNTAGLIGVLRDAGLELNCDVSGVAALRLLARQAAATGYRQRLQRDGETIRLLGVGADLPNLVLADIDADVKAIEPRLGEERPSERYLDLLIRRRGRLLLTGLPGSGKSTAMRKAAAQQAGTARRAATALYQLEPARQADRYRTDPRRTGGDRLRRCS